jgi:pimeloyl-ACP methyl ester carboxylesterase
MDFNPTKAIVHHEGCNLHYWYQGKGPLITFVPGGNGHGRQYNPIMAALSDRFTCVTFDRRQMSASQVQVNKKMSPYQQARDIRAVIRAVGFDKSIVFGSSSGGLFSLQFAIDFPEMVDRLIVHEAPMQTILPDAAELFEWFLHLYELYETQGWEQASGEFVKKLIGIRDEGVPKTAEPEPGNAKNFWDNEVFSLLGYAPNLWQLKKNKTSVGIMRAVRSKDAFYARSAEEQAKILDCPFFLVPGHHMGFEVELEAFLPFFLGMLNTLEKRSE